MAWFLARAFRRLGWQVAVFDDRAYVGRRLPGIAGTAVQVLERDHGMTGRSRRLGRILRLRARGCDLAVTVKGEYLQPDDVAAISALVPFVNWHPDHPVLDQHFAAVAHYTAFCPKDSWSVERMRNMGLYNVVRLPHASDPEVLAGDRHEPADASVSVVGSVYPYRRHWIDEVRTAGLRVEVFGGSVPDGVPGVRSRKERVVGADQGRALRHGLFTLNTHHPHDVAGGNQRVFDAAAAGAPQLTERLPETLRHFKPDSEICAFDDREEFRFWVAELAGNADLRCRLGEASRERLREEHTYEHRVQSVLSLL
jgi:spore maturation protein CgeB